MRDSNKSSLNPRQKQACFVSAKTICQNIIPKLDKRYKKRPILLPLVKAYDWSIYKSTFTDYLDVSVWFSNSMATWIMNNNLVNI